MAEDGTPMQRSCGAMQEHERLLRTDASYAAARVESENRAWQYATRAAFPARTGVTVIPVVVHVVYKTAAQNISDAQVRSQIEVLNRDFRKTNPDVSSTPAPFAPLAADARIEFELATTDPGGAATGGIIRTATTRDSFGDDNAVKSAATGGADAWPRDRYLNLWACQLTPWLGYAQFPGGPAATDGVVVLHTAFGTNGTAAAPFNLGRTATHEVGHWLNLRHIWGDDGTGCSGSDFVDDTPNCGGANYGAPAFPRVTCNNGPNGDMFMNYMDYTDDRAMFMFTAGQVTRMQATLDGERSSIGSTRPGPVLTLKFRDDPGGAVPTLKFRDDPVVPTLKFRDDPVVPTLKFRDDPVAPTLKFRDDPFVPKNKFVDDPPKLKFVDDPLATSPAADVGGIPVPGPQVVDPAPFVLATPHHSMAWARSFPEAFGARVASVRAQLEQYEQLLGQYAEADASGGLSPADVADGDRLYAEYTGLAEEYRQLGGG